MNMESYEGRCIRRCKSLSEGREMESEVQNDREKHTLKDNIVLKLKS